MQSTADKYASKAIEDYLKANVEIPADVERFARLASWDLWSGPMTYCEECGVDHLDDCTCEHKYPGFTKACAIVSEWVDNNLKHTTLYVTEDSWDVTTREPEGHWMDSETYEECDESDDNAVWADPMPYYAFERKEILAILFDKELISYL